MQAGQQCSTAAPAVLHTAKSGRTVFFCLPHSPRAARPTASGSIRFMVEVLCSCLPVMGQHLSSVVDLLSLYKPSTQESHKERHQAWAPHRTAAVSRWAFPVPPQGRTAAVPRGALKEAEHSQGTPWIQCDRIVCAIRTGTGAAIHDQPDPALVFPPGTSESPPKPTPGSAADSAE